MEPMSAPQIITARTRALRGMAGLCMAAVGGLGLAGLFYVADSRTPLAQRLLFQIGLGPSVLLSAIAQSLIVVGLLMVWTALRKRGSDSV